MSEWIAYLLVGFGVMFIGISKAGFGGGMGMLTVPICVVGLGELGKDTLFAIGFLLPLLCLGDGISLWHYRRSWNWGSVKPLVPGAIIGIVVGSILMGRVSASLFQILLGLVAVVFVLFHLFREKILGKPDESVDRKPEPPHVSWIFGILSGMTSTFAHGAGPLVAMYLIPKNLPKSEFVGTNALIFSVINWMKVPFFFMIGAIHLGTLQWNLMFFMLVPAGVAVGIFLHGKVSEVWFRNIVLITTCLAGVKLLASGFGG